MSSQPSTHNNDTQSDEALPPKKADAATPASHPSTQQNAPKKKKSWLRWVWRFFLLIFILLILALVGLWVWSGREGSLAQAITLAQRYVPIVGNSLQVENVQGSIRHGGHIAHLRWQQAGMVDVKVTELDYVWSPTELIHRTLPIGHISADQVQVLTAPKEDTEENKPLPPAPENIGLPIHITLDALKVNTVIYGEADKGLVVSDILADYAFDGTAHHLTLKSLNFAQGSYQAQITLKAQNPEINAKLLAELAFAVPGSEQQAQVNAVLQASGPLTELHIQANAQAHTLPATDNTSMPAVASGAKSIETAATPQAQSSETTADENDMAAANRIDLQAVITPWVKMIVPQATLTVDAVDAGAFWPQAPHTLLSGLVQVSTTPSELSQQDLWQLAAQIQNENPGPIDKARVPLSALNIQASWQNNIATLQQLELQAAGGAITAQGQLKVPAELIENATTAQEENTATSQNASQNITGALAATPPTWHVQADISQVQLKELHTGWADEGVLHGNLNASQASQELRFDTKLQAAGMDMNGQGTFALQNQTTNGNLNLVTPGLQLSAQAEHLHATQGNAQLKLEVADAEKTLAWVQTIPLLPELIRAYSTQGSASLNASIKNGWQKPVVDAHITIPDLLVSQQTAEKTPTAKELIHLKETQIAIQGHLEQATLEAKADILLAQQQVQLQLQAQGGMKNDNISVHINQLEAAVANLITQQNGPAQVKPLVTARAGGPFQVSWQQTQQLLKLAPGTLELAFADNPNQAPSLVWDKTTWHAGEIASSGKLTEFPVAWLTSFTGNSLSDMDIKGDLMLEGGWKIHIGQSLDFSVEILRSSGDISLEPEGNAFSGAGSQRLQAGIRQAHIKLYNTGNDIHAEVLWDSENASIVDIKANTVLSRSEGQWTIKPDAPLSGEAILQLPQIGVFTAFAPPGWRFGGAAILDSELGGTLSRPQIKGRLTAMGLTLRSVLDDVQFTNGKVDMAFDGNHVQLNEVSLHGSGEKGGTIKADGAFNWSGETPSAQMKIVIEHLRASVRNDRQLTASGQINIGLQNNELHIKGDVGVDQALIVVGGSGAPSLDDDVVILTPQARQEVIEKASPPALKPALPFTPHLALTLNMGKNFRVQGFGLQTYLRGELAISNQGLTPRIIGDINTFGGRFRAYGQNLNVETGIIRFSGIYNNPTLNILTIRPNTTEKVGVQVIGTASSPSVRLYSESGLPDSETLSWLVFGRPASADGKEVAVLQQAALALLSGGDGAGITGQLADTLGLDEISLGSSNSTASSSEGEDTLSSTTITVSKRLTDSFYVAYEHNLGGAMGTFYAFYEISRRLTLRGESGENTAIDLIYTLRFDAK